MNLLLAKNAVREIRRMATYPHQHQMGVHLDLALELLNWVQFPDDEKPEPQMPPPEPIAACQGVLGSLFGHNFRARYSEVNPVSRTYHCDVCERCGALSVDTSGYRRQGCAL
jgi:hypothetical protein